MGLNYFIYNILPKRLSSEIKKLYNETNNDYKHLLYKITVYNEEQTIYYTVFYSVKIKNLIKNLLSLKCQ